MNIAQRLIVAAGAILAAARVVFPVRYGSLPGLRFSETSGLPEFMVKTDWRATGLHVALIAALTVILAVLFKKK